MARRGRSILSSVGGSRKTLQNILLYTAAGIGGQIIKVAVEKYQASNPTLPSFTQDIVLIGGGFALAFAPVATKGWSHEAKAAAAFLGLTMAVGRIFEYFRATVGFGVAPAFNLPTQYQYGLQAPVPQIATVPSVTGTA